MPALTLRGNSDSTLMLEIDADETGYPHSDPPPPGPEDEPVEYAALIANYIRAVKANRVDKDYSDEILQMHRELSMARNLAKSMPRAQWISKIRSLGG